MPGQRLFGVVIRTCGLICCLWGFWNLLWAFFQGAGLVTITEDTREYFLQGVAFFLVGLFLMRSAAPYLLRFSYPDVDKDEP